LQPTLLETIGSSFAIAAVSIVSSLPSDAVDIVEFSSRMSSASSTSSAAAAFAAAIAFALALAAAMARALALAFALAMDRA
jgi:hypothetical protein